MAGFKLQRPDGSIAVDANYFNLGLRQTGRVRTTLNGGNTPNIRGATFTVNTDQAILAFRAPSPVGVTHAVVSGGTTTYYLFGFSQEQQDFDIDWWLFDLPAYALQYTSGGKLIVRRPTDGVTVFDSRNKYMKVMDFYLDNSNADSFRDYAKTPAVVQVNRAWGWLQQPMQPNVYRREQTTSMAWTSGNRVLTGVRNTLFEMIRFDGVNPAYFSYGGGNRQLMVVDVENY